MTDATAETERQTRSDSATHELLRQLVRNGAEMAHDISEIKARLCGGDQRFEDHARRVAAVEADARVAKEQSAAAQLELAVMADRVATLKAIVYGAVATVLVGVLGVAGTALIIVLKMKGAT